MAATQNVIQAPSARNSSEEFSISEIQVPRSGVVTLFGYPIKVIVERGHLLLEDGIGFERRRTRLPRVGHGLERLIVIGADGFVSLSALRWLSDQGAAFIMLERSGKVLTITGPVRPSDARLRRAQALATETGADVVIARELIHQKLLGQEQVAREQLRDSATAEQIATCRLDLAEAETLDAVRTLESRGAAAYWAAWRGLKVAFPAKELQSTPDHWRTFGTRKSLLTGSQRLATNPPNAILNLLYAILETESRLAAAALGLDPGLGFIHLDAAARDSLACDLMEPVRPKVDAYVLRLLRETLSRKYFFEQRDGNCRLMATFAAHLAQTAPIWAREVAPIAEWIARTLWAGRHRAPSDTGIATRLTQSRKREAKGRDSVPKPPPLPTLARLCRDCGKPLKTGTEHCRVCDVKYATARMSGAARIGRIKARGPEAGAKRGITQRQHHLARSAWMNSNQATHMTKDRYLSEVQPHLRELPTRRIARELGVTVMYAGMIRKGYVPHPRHWQALAQLAAAPPEALDCLLHILRGSLRNDFRNCESDFSNVHETNNHS